MNVYRIYIFIIWLSHPFVDELTKKREKNLESLYMHVYIFVYAYMFVFSLCISLNIYFFIAVHELRGASMKLNFNPCIYNSMSFVIIKTGEIVGPEAHHSSFDDD